jgi:mannobiose 2-epimerase
MSSNPVSPSRHVFSRHVFAGLFLAIGLLLGGCTTDSKTESQPRQQLASEIETALTKHLLDVWYPRVIDEEHGGYLSTFSHDWTPVGDQEKMIVTQARHVWTLSEASHWYPEREYLEAARRGVAFLSDHMWDETYGGFYTTVDRTGQPPLTDDEPVLKEAYGQAFAIYGLSAYFEASGDSTALRLAQKGFRWLETHSYDSEHGGYFQFLRRDGTPHTDGYEGTPPKDYNSSIHLLEALTELYRVWPDSLVRKRLREMFHVVRDTMVAEKGYLQLYFRRDWAPVTYEDSTAAAQDQYRLGHVTFGHDVETAYLLLEAAHALGREDPAATRKIGKRMVDHALRHGWDDEEGGLYDRGYYFAGDDRVTITDSTKTWWSQAEMLNTLLLMSELYPDDSRGYVDTFEQQWAYVQNYLIDEKHGGWYRGGLDEAPNQEEAPKAGIWKGNYHTARSLMNSLTRLQSDRSP